MTSKEALTKISNMASPYYWGSKEHIELTNIVLKDLDKLAQLENIEKELGVDLITLFKALQQGYIYLDVKENNKGITEIVTFEVGGILFDKEDKVWRLTNADTYDGAFWGSLATNKNYGKTWALTKEELE